MTLDILYSSVVVSHAYVFVVCACMYVCMYLCVRNIFAYVVLSERAFRNL